MKHHVVAMIVYRVCNGMTLVLYVTSLDSSGHITRVMLMLVLTLMLISDTHFVFTPPPPPPPPPPQTRRPGRDPNDNICPYCALHTILITLHRPATSRTSFRYLAGQKLGYSAICIIPTKLPFIPP